MFEKSISQSNPIFGKVFSKPDSFDMANHGYITPARLVILEPYDKTGKYIYIKDDNDIAAKEKQFLNDLKEAAISLDRKIKKDSRGQRRAFLFVTTRGSSFLRYVRDCWSANANDKQAAFARWANDNQVGIYMTCCENYEAGSEFHGKGLIKKSTKTVWEQRELFIGDFTDVLNDDEMTDPKYKDLNLTKEDIQNHINILINIDQCNTGINLPSLNGCFISRLITKDNPLALQIPGRVMRPDGDDLDIIGKVETSAYSNKCEYVKPFCYIYYSAAEFDYNEMQTVSETIGLLYMNYNIQAKVVEKYMIGLGEKDDVFDNTNKQEDETYWGEAPLNRKDYIAKYTEFHKDLLSIGRFANVQEMFEKMVKLAKDKMAEKGIFKRKDMDEFFEKVAGDEDENTTVGLENIIDKFNAI